MAIGRTNQWMNNYNTAQHANPAVRQNLFATPANQATPQMVSPQTQYQLANPSAGSAWGRAAAGREQAMYGVDRYGNTAPGNGGTGGTGGTGQYQTGITAGIVPPSVVQQGFGAMGIQGPGAGTVNTQYNDLMRQGLNQVGTQFGRDAAFDMANLDLAQQRARADAGLGMGNLLARLFEGNLANDRAQQGLSGDFLMGLLG